MFPPQLALVVWIFASVALFALMSPLRAFLLTYVIGILFLPVETGNVGTYVATIPITQSLRIDKFTACHIGALLGTLIFAPHVLRRYRFHWIDLLIILIDVGVFLSSVLNDHTRDAFSNSVELLRVYAPLLVLARMHIVTAGDLHEAMHAVIGGAFVYSFICVFEWRFSPQLHRIVYGYFQHSFDQFMRYDHFRPVGFLRHAIELSFMMGIATALAGWLWFKNLLKPLWGVVPAWAVFTALLVGLACTLTFSGYLAVALCAAFFVLMQVTRSRWVLCILPLVAAIWMFGRFTDVISADLLVRAAGDIDRNRAASLQYRFESERKNITDIGDRILFGKGTMEAVARDADGHIVMYVDAWWLITLSCFGIVGLVGWFFLWCAGLITTLPRWNRLTPDLRTLAIAVAVLTGVQFIDFLVNSFPSLFLLMLNAGLISVLQHYRPAPAPVFAPVPPPAFAFEGVPAT